MSLSSTLLFQSTEWNKESLVYYEDRKRQHVAGCFRHKGLGVNMGLLLSLWPSLQGCCKAKRVGRGENHKHFPGLLQGRMV